MYTVEWYPKLAKLWETLDNKGQAIPTGLNAIAASLNLLLQNMNVQQFIFTEKQRQAEETSAKKAAQRGAVQKDIASFSTECFENRENDGGALL